MSISIIGNQPVRFRTEAQIDAENCNCDTKPYCQLVNKNDDTSWQIKTETIVDNGNFNNNLDGWVIKQELSVSVEITNESDEGQCDGQLVITATGGTGPYEYSLDGVTFQSSDTFGGLCVGCYNIVVKDSLDNLGFVTACIDVNVDCAAFDMTDELLPYNTSQFLNCLTSDFL